MADTVQSRPFSVLQFMTHWSGGWFWPIGPWAGAEEARKTRPRAATADRIMVLSGMAAGTLSDRTARAEWQLIPRKPFGTIYRVHRRAPHRGRAKARRHPFRPAVGRWCMVRCSGRRRRA